MATLLISDDVPSRRRPERRAHRRRPLRASALAFSAALALAAGPAPAWANLGQDLFGLGSRVKAMGGAGTAAAADSAAVYYNPAGLTHCRTNGVSVELSHLDYSLDVTTDRDDLAPAGLEDRTAVALGACIFLPMRLSFGIALEAGLENPQVLRQRSLSSDPEFALYGQSVEQITVMGGLGYRVDDWLAVGVGGAVLVNSDLDLSNSVPVVSPGQELENQLAWHLKPTAALYLGATVDAAPGLRLGVAYRTALYHRLTATALTQVELAGIPLDVDLLLESVAWYSPRQLALGAAYDVKPKWTVAGDLTWYDWSNYPGPFLHASPLEEGPSIAGALTLPPEEPANFSDIVVPRLGAEYLLGSSLAVRLGLSFRPSPAPGLEGDRRSNLLDGAVTTVTLGAGTWWGAGAPGLRSPVTSRSAQSPQQRANGGTVDAHLRFHTMAGESVTKRPADGPAYSLTYGGWLVDAGLTVTLGWF
jgi:long-chain fatty acid transport protein